VSGAAGGRAFWLGARSACVSLGLVSALSANAAAAPCGRPDVDVTFPPNAAEAVPQNAILAAHYRAPADWQDEGVTLTGPDGAELAVDVSYDAAESTLRAVPQGTLLEGEHRIVWPALRGVATGVGLGQTASFRVGASEDVAAPRFSGASGIEWQLLREQDPCTSGLEDRFQYDIELGELSDDQARSLLSVVVFETRSPTHTSGVPKQLAVLPLANDGHIHVERSSTRSGVVCFAAILRDLALFSSGGGDQEVCAKTTEPPYFEGCSLSPRSTHEHGWGFAVILGLLGVRRIARRRHTGVALGALGLLGCDERTSQRSAPPEPPGGEASAFLCREEQCSQRHVRLPDDGEWRCADLDGAVLCAGGETAAGVVPVGAGRGYRCGERRGSARRERVCVDSAPDFPPGGRAEYRCRFDAEHGLTRECAPRETQPNDAVAALPARAPECWLDADCQGPCVKGYCAGARR
jgi:hypothetical protein